MVTYLTTPRYRFTSNGTVLADHFISGEVILKENTYWTAAFNINNAASVYPSASMYKGVIIKLEVKDDAISGSYQTLFEGYLLFAETSFDMNGGAIVKIQCVGYGYSLEMMNVAQEYGAQTSTINSGHILLDSIQSILSDSELGVIPRWVNYINGSLVHVSGWSSLTTTYIENLTGSIPYIVSPSKPTSKFVDDLCDLHTAISEVNDLAGPHWIVDHSKNFRLKRVGASQTGWTNYYGNSQANATLAVGVDFIDGKFQDLPYEANIIKYYGAWRRPSNGDYWTENNSTLWTTTEAGNSLDDYATDPKVGAYSLRAKTSASPYGPLTVIYPSAKNAAWDFSGFTDFNTPNMNFYLYYDNDSGNYLYIRLSTTDNDYFDVTLTPTKQVWQHLSIPIGPHFNDQENNNLLWATHGSPDWGEINFITFYANAISDYNAGLNRYFFLVDGLHFGGATVCRVARQYYFLGEGLFTPFYQHIAPPLTHNPAKFKVITDNVGKDDSLVADDDTGLMAQLAKAELMRCTTAPTIGQFTTLLISDVLPGQCFYIGKAYRITQVTHNLPDATSNQPPTSHFEVTDDVINSHTRMRYDDVNKLYEAVRPSWQDRQASSIKAGNMDIRITPLEKAYAIGDNPEI